MANVTNSRLTFKQVPFLLVEGLVLDAIRVVTSKVRHWFFINTFICDRFMFMCRPLTTLHNLVTKGVSSIGSDSCIYSNACEKSSGTRSIADSACQGFKACEWMVSPYVLIIIIHLNQSFPLE